jgi:hypothetical protein
LRIVSCDICQVWAILVSMFPSFPCYKEGTGGRGQIEPGPPVIKYVKMGGTMRWAELKMCRFWAGGISSCPFSRAREYRLLRRLGGLLQTGSRKLAIINILKPEYV